MDNLAGKTALVTGGTSGIGRAVALALARRAANVWIVGRDHVRGNALVTAAAAEGIGQVSFLQADVSDMGQVRRVAAQVQAASPELHMLIHSAGGHFFQRACTADGIEVNFATNYLSKFLLTNLLLPRLTRSAPARIVVVGSPIVDPKRWLAFSGFYSSVQPPLRAFLNSGLTTAVWTAEMARRLAGGGVTITNVNPGTVRTNIGRTWPMPLRVFDHVLQALSGVSAAEGAAAPVYLATAPELAGVNGQFLQKMTRIHAPASTYDVDIAQHLWAFSEQLVGQLFPVFSQPMVQVGTR